MIWEFSNSSAQTINPGEDAVFTEAAVYNNSNLVRYREGTGSILLAGKVNRCACGCMPKTADYVVSFESNIAVPTGGTPGQIGVAITLNGSTLPNTEMFATPAAVGDLWDVSDTTVAPVWSGCCETLTVRNISDQPITMQNANIIIFRNSDC